jgi:hypothetical protein
MTHILPEGGLCKPHSHFADNDKENVTGGTSAIKSGPHLIACVLPPEGGEAREIKVTRRIAWCLHELVRAGTQGITSLSYAGARLSHYIFCLRRQGIVIDVAREPNIGAFGGTHGRYRLKSRVRIIKSVGLGPNPQSRSVLA